MTATARNAISSPPLLQSAQRGGPPPAPGACGGQPGRGDMDNSSLANVFENDGRGRLTEAASLGATLEYRGRASAKWK